MKTCSKCLIAKPESEFYPRPDRPGALRPRCKSCHRGKSKKAWGLTTLWRTTSAPQSAVLHIPGEESVSVEFSPAGEIVGRGFPEDILKPGSSLVVTYEEGRIVARGERRVTVKHIDGMVDAYRWGCDGALNRLFSNGRWKPAIWRAPGSSATIKDARLVAVTESLTESLGSTKIPRVAV
jgi:hypothetical protein